VAPQARPQNRPPIKSSEPTETPGQASPEPSPPAKSQESPEPNSEDPDSHGPQPRTQADQWLPMSGGDGRLMVVDF
jgi:hypothetical protein